LNNKRQRKKLLVKRFLTIEREGLSEENVMRFEKAERFAPMSPTVTKEDGKVVLLLEAFYWGIRKLVERVTRDQSSVSSAVDKLRRSP
jgi:hypothetical protein